MRNGLKIIQIPGNYYGRSVTRVGWMRRISGDEWILLPGARTLIRTSGARVVDSLASDGPKRDHEMSEPSKGPEEIHRLVIKRSLPADEKTWAKHCPRPEGWTE